MRYNFRLYLELARKYKWHFVFLIFIVTLISLTRVAEKLFFKVLIDDGTAFTAGTLSATDFIAFLGILAIAYGITVFVKTCAHWINLHLVNRLDTALMYDIKRKFFDHIIGLSHRFHTTHKTGSMISRVTRGARAIEGITDALVMNGAPLVIQIIVVASSVWYFDRQSAIVILLTCAAFITYSLYILRIHMKANVEMNTAEDAEKANIGDVFTNIDSIKYFGKEHTIKQKYAALAQITRKKFIQGWDYYRWMEAGQSFIIAVGVFFLIYFPLQQFIAGTMSLGTLTFLYTVYFNIAEPLYGFVWGARRFYECMADLQGLAEYDRLTNDIKDAPHASELHVKNGALIFENVSFKYNTKKVIENFDLSIKPNEKIALVGHSGSGKTTIVKLLYRLYDLHEGAIKIKNRFVQNCPLFLKNAFFSTIPFTIILHSLDLEPQEKK